jgi:hypothetical protein
MAGVDFTEKLLLRLKIPCAIFPTAECTLYKKQEAEPMTDEELEAIYGPVAPHAEFERGEPLSYRDNHGVTKTGTIVWVRAGEMVVERVKEPRLDYVVATGTGSLEIVRAEQILRERERRAEHE